MRISRKKFRTFFAIFVSRPTLHHLLPSPLLDVPNERLRQKTQKHYLFRNKQACRTKRVGNFFTFKYFM